MRLELYIRLRTGLGLGVEPSYDAGTGRKPYGLRARYVKQK